MKIDVKELYEESFWDWYDYQPMLDAFGKIAIQIDDRGYQGDSRLLYDENGKIGFLIFGWGSCSGCDALQACKTLEDVQKLCDELQNDIKWFDNREQALKWFTNHDWQGDYSWHYSETREFVEKSIEYLSNRAEPITNYERIRNMSVDDLAAILSHAPCVFCKLEKRQNCAIPCVVAIKQWLESEVTEE